MKNVISRNKPTATFDAENHRFIITPVDTDKAVSVGTVLRAIKEADLITHSGTFHSDDIFSTVILKNILDKECIKICIFQEIKRRII